MEKSFNIIVQETKQKIIQDITDSKLPAMVVQMIINEIKQNVDVQTQQILQHETEEYNKELNKSTEI